MEESKKIPLYYCNVIQVEAGAFDFKLGIKKNRHKHVSEEDFDFEVIMSPQHAKIFLRVLSEVIENYEKDFGVIDVNIKQKDSTEKK